MTEQLPVYNSEEHREELGFVGNTARGISYDTHYMCGNHGFFPKEKVHTSKKGRLLCPLCHQQVRYKPRNVERNYPTTTVKPAYQEQEKDKGGDSK